MVINFTLRAKRVISYYNTLAVFTSIKKIIHFISSNFLKQSHFCVLNCYKEMFGINDKVLSFSLTIMNV